jgi:exopolysaccharide biosynthesis predicted pyruvyltransferase EpsI
MKQHNYKKDVVKVLDRLSKNYPTQRLATHIGIALADYPHFDSISDKELYFALEKYECEKELDILSPSYDIDDIIEDGKNLQMNDDYEEDEY